MVRRFREAFSFQTNCTQWLLTWNLTLFRRWKLPHFCSTCTTESQNVLLSVANCFQDTCHFGTTVWNDPKMTLKTDFELKCALYNLLVPINEFQILIHFTLQPAIFELFEITVMNDHRMTLNSTRSKVCVLLVPQLSKFKSILPNDEPLLSYMPFWDKCT